MGGRGEGRKGRGGGGEGKGRERRGGESRREWGGSLEYIHTTMRPFFFVTFDSLPPPDTSPLVPTAPHNVTLSDINLTSMMVTWEEPTMPNGILGPYNVCTLGLSLPW